MKGLKLLRIVTMVVAVSLFAFAGAMSKVDMNSYAAEESPDPITVTESRTITGDCGQVFVQGTDDAKDITITLDNANIVGDIEIESDINLTIKLMGVNKVSGNIRNDYWGTGKIKLSIEGIEGIEGKLEVGEDIEYIETLSVVNTNLTVLSEIEYINGLNISGSTVNVTSRIYLEGIYYGAKGVNKRMAKAMSEDSSYTFSGGNLNISKSTVTAKRIKAANIDISEGSTVNVTSRIQLEGIYYGAKGVNKRMAKAMSIASSIGNLNISKSTVDAERIEAVNIDISEGSKVTVKYYIYVMDGSNAVGGVNKRMAKAMLSTSSSGNINISGGDVTAGQVFADMGTLNVSGGKLTVTGVPYYYYMPGTIVGKNIIISGGFVDAKVTDSNMQDQYYAVAYGVTSATNPVAAIAIQENGKITITGGNIIATGSDNGDNSFGPGIGIQDISQAVYYSLGEKTYELYISGGNIKTTGIDERLKPYVSEADQTMVSEKIFTLIGGSNEPVLGVEGIGNYGLKDVKAIEGKLYFYLPEQVAPSKITAGNNDTYLPKEDDKTAFVKQVINQGGGGYDYTPPVTPTPPVKEEVIEVISDKNVAVVKKVTGMELLRELYKIANGKKGTDKIVKKWAIDNKLVKKTFSFNKNISLNKASVILYKFAKMKKLDLKFNVKALDKIEDKAKILKNSIDPVKWMISKKLIAPTKDENNKKYLNPTKALTDKQLKSIILKLKKLK